MNQMQFTVEIKAPASTVWDTLWQDQTLREWAAIIDPGTYMMGEMEKGSVVQFISAENGYGVSSLIEELTKPNYVLFRHSSDTQDSGLRSRENQWTGGSESYSLSEQDGVTTLTALFDIPAELQDYFTDVYPKALKKVKELAEK